MLSSSYLASMIKPNQIIVYYCSMSVCFGY